LCDRQAEAARRAGDDADLALRAGRHEPLTCSSPALDAESNEMVHYRTIVPASPVAGQWPGPRELPHLRVVHLRTRLSAS
jgi:hypothetical protein